MEEHKLHAPLNWIEHYPEHEGEIGAYSLVEFSSWEPVEVYLGSVWRCRIGPPEWLPLHCEDSPRCLTQEVLLALHQAVARSPTASLGMEVPRVDCIVRQRKEAAKLCNPR